MSIGIGAATAEERMAAMIAAEMVWNCMIKEAFSGDCSCEYQAPFNHFLSWFHRHNLRRPIHG